jgi:hypothetical protein
MIAKPVYVRALNDYCIFVCFDDGMQGTVDLKHLAHKGVFRAWSGKNKTNMRMPQISHFFGTFRPIRICNSVFLQDCKFCGTEDEIKPFIPAGMAVR